MDEFDKCMFCKNMMSFTGVQMIVDENGSPVIYEETNDG